MHPPPERKVRDSAVMVLGKTIGFELPPSLEHEGGLRVLTEKSEAAWFERLFKAGCKEVQGPLVNGLYAITFESNAPDEELIQRVQRTLRGIKYQR